MVTVVKISCSFNIGAQAEGRGGGVGGKPSPQVSKILKFWGQNAYNSGNSSWEKTKKKKRKKRLLIPKCQVSGVNQVLTDDRNL